MLYSIERSMVLSQRDDYHDENIKDLSFLVLIRTVQEF